jgi:hypothetical protein
MSDTDIEKWIHSLIIERGISGINQMRDEALANDLCSRAPKVLPALPTDKSRRALLPFYEAYFSNYIEGTEFVLPELVRGTLRRGFDVGSEIASPFARANAMRDSGEADAAGIRLILPSLLK